MAITKERNDLDTSLSNFYAKPVAIVSLELILSMGLVIFLGFFAVKPTLTTMSDLIKEIDDKKELTKQLDNKIAALGSAQAVYLAIQDRLTVLDEAIPSQPHLISSLKIIEKLAGENNVIVDSIGVPTIPDEVADISNGTKLARVSLPVTITVKGDYVDIRAYVEALKNSRRSIVINTVTFNIEENRGDRKLSASITVNLPYFGVSS